MSSPLLPGEQLQQAHQSLNTRMADVTPEQVHWRLRDQANPLGATTAHVLLGEDLVLTIRLLESPQVSATHGAGKIGLCALPPLPTRGRPPLPSWKTWGRAVQLELGVLHAYAQADDTCSDTYLASVSEEAPGCPLDRSVFGVRNLDLVWVMSHSIIGHVHHCCGETAYLKGLHDACSSLTQRRVRR